MFCLSLNTWNDEHGVNRLDFRGVTSNGVENFSEINRGGVFSLGEGVAYGGYEFDEWRMRVYDRINVDGL